MADTTPTPPRPTAYDRAVAAQQAPAQETGQEMLTKLDEIASLIADAANVSSRSTYQFGEEVKKILVAMSKTPEAQNAKALEAIHEVLVEIQRGLDLQASESITAADAREKKAQEAREKAADDRQQKTEESASKLRREAASRLDDDEPSSKAADKLKSEIASLLDEVRNQKKTVAEAMPLILSNTKTLNEFVELSKKSISYRQKDLTDEDKGAKGSVGEFFKDKLGPITAMFSKKGRAEAISEYADKKGGLLGALIKQISGSDKTIEVATRDENINTILNDTDAGKAAIKRLGGGEKGREAARKEYEAYFKAIKDREPLVKKLQEEAERVDNLYRTTGIRLESTAEATLEAMERQNKDALVAISFGKPKPQDDFVGPMPQKPQEDPPEAAVEPLQPEAFVGPMPQDDFVGPIQPEAFVGPMQLEQTEIAIAEIEAISELRDSSKTSEAHLAAILAELIKSNTKSLEDYEPGDAASATPTRTMAIPGLSGTSAGADGEGEGGGGEGEGGGGLIAGGLAAAGAGLLGYAKGKLIKGAVRKGGKLLGQAGKSLFGKVKGLGSKGLGKLGALGALATTGFTVADTDTEDYRKRFGLETTDPSLLGDMGVRLLGAASDLGNIGTFGLAGKWAGYRDLEEKKEMAIKAEAEAAKLAEVAAVDSTATKVENATSAEDLAKEAAIATAIEEERIRSEKAGAAPAPQVATITTNTQVNTNNTTVVRPDIRNQEPSWMRQESNRYGF